MGELALFDIGWRPEFDVPAELTAAFEMAGGVAYAGAVAEFDGDVLLVSKDSAELDARGKQDAALLDLFGQRTD